MPDSIFTMSMLTSVPAMRLASVGTPASELPVPPIVSNPDVLPHIESLRRNQVMLPRCQECLAVIWYPRRVCPAFGGRTITWFRATGHGTIYSHTLVHRGVGAYQSAIPYILAQVELDEGTRVLTNIITPGNEVAIGMSVQAVINLDDETPILRFEAAPCRTA